MDKKIICIFMLGLSIIALGCVQQPGEKIVVGAKPFNEQFILANMMVILLEENGYSAEVNLGLGGTFVNYEALKQNQIQAYVEYTGTVYSQILKLPALDVWDSDVVYSASEEGLLNEGVIIAADLGFEDAYAIAVRSDWAAENSVSRISDLESYSADMVIGVDPEFATRPDGLPQLKEVYGINFKDDRQGIANIMYEAMRNDQVDVISAYTTDTRNDLFNLTLLEDDRNALPPYSAVILISSDFAEENPGAAEVLKRLEGRIDTETMRSLNYEFDVNKRDAEEIAREYLVSAGLIR